MGLCDEVCWEVSSKHYLMLCKFDLCELWNMLFGGIVIGIIASFLFVGITQLIAKCKFKKKYKFLESKSTDVFDWIAYSMKSENGRIKEETPNGSSVNIKINQGRIYLHLVQNDKREWHGELLMDSNGFGIVSYKYTDAHEYGKRQCTIGFYQEGGKKIDYLFLSPLNDRIYYINNHGDKSTVVYNYGDEIFIRARD